MYERRDMTVKVIYFVHGTTTDNLEHKSTGWIPGELSEKGVQQSIELRNQIDMNKIDLVISSDLKRAIDSAEYAFGGLKEITHDDRLRECNYGDLNGKSSSLVVYEDHISEPFPNGESLKDVEARIRDFCDFLKEEYDGKTVAVVAHKAPQFAFEVITQNITWEEAIKNDWRKVKAWRPGWEYIIK
jgi:broad specificity phosphatase PhoE